MNVREVGYEYFNKSFVSQFPVVSPTIVAERKLRIVYVRYDGKCPSGTCDDGEYSGIIADDSGEIVGRMANSLELKPGEKYDVYNRPAQSIELRSRYRQ